MHKYSIIFFGNEQLAQGLSQPITPTFEYLLTSQHGIKALILPSQNNKKPFLVETLAKSHSIPVFYTKNSQEISKIIADFKPDLGILASFGQIIPQTIIDAFPNGILNIHPSLLPKYRGTTPIESAILNADQTTGVSVMQLVAAMDAGPILAQQTFQIPQDVTKQTLYEELARTGANLLAQILDSATSLQDYPKTQQDEKSATFTKPLSKTLSKLDPENKSAATLLREINAYLNFPKSKLRLLDLDCTITAAHVASVAATQLDPLCQDGNYLVVDKLIPPGRKEMIAADFLRGYLKN